MPWVVLGLAGALAAGALAGWWVSRDLRAELAYQEALSKDPGNPEVTLNLASLYLAQGGYAKATQALQHGTVVNIPGAGHNIRRERFAEYLGYVQSFLEQSKEYFLQWTGDPARSQQLAVQTLDHLRQRQAASLAFFDIFWVCAVLSALLVPLVLLMKRSVTEKGEHVSAH